MSNPRISALLSGGAVIYFAYSIFTATESPSPSLAMIQWIFLLLAGIGLVGSLIKIAKGE